jgi:plastin-1
MRTHTLQIIGNKTEEELIKWGNELADEEHRIKSLKDKSLKNSMFFIDIMKSIEPRAINWDIVIKDKDDNDSLANNAKYALSIARKLGATVFLVWEDISEVKPRLLLTFLASLYDVAQNYKPR